MRGLGLSEALAVVIMVGVVLALAVVFIIVSGVNMASASASVSLSQAETTLVNIAQDLNAAVMSGVPYYSLSYPLPTTQFGVYNVVRDYCDLIVVNTTHAVVWSVTSDAMVFGIPPNYLTMPSGFHKVLFSNDSLIFNGTSSSFFGVSQLGAGSLGGVSYGTYVVLYPRVGVVNATSSDVVSSSAYVAYVFVPVVVARFNPALPNLLVANVTAPSMVTIESPLYLKYACGTNQPPPFRLSSYSKIEIVEIEVIIEYG
jgi:hypothetical protein